MKRNKWKTAGIIAFNIIKYLVLACVIVVGGMAWVLYNILKVVVAHA